MRVRCALAVMVVAGCSLVTGGWTAGPAESSYEAPPVLRAGDLAPADLLQGPRHLVDEQVPTDGLLARFTIRSDFGVFEAAGPGMLRVRVGGGRTFTSNVDGKPGQGTARIEDGKLVFVGSNSRGSATLYKQGGRSVLRGEGTLVGISGWSAFEVTRR